MDILKLTKIVVYVILLSSIISCSDSKQYYYNRSKTINLRYCDIRKTEINSAHIAMFKKGTNFNFLENQDSIFTIEKFVLSPDSINLKDHFIDINFKHIDTFPTNKDYILTINKKHVYKISGIDTTSIKKKRGALMIRIVRNQIKSLIINGERIDTENLTIPCNISNETKEHLE